MAISQTLNDLWRLKTLLIIILAPLLLLPLPVLVPSPEGKCAYVVFLMAVYWITESLPIPVTALLPMVLFPVLNVVPAKVIAKSYMNDTIMVFLGGLCVAVAIEDWNIHKRIALRILLLVGSEPRRLMLGLMIATWFLSMWISNTATTAMMVPIANAILMQLKDTKHVAVQDTGAEATEMEDISPEQVTVIDNVGAGKKEKPATTMSIISTNDALQDDKDMDFDRMKKALSLCIAYAANSGGIGSLTGTGPNLVLKGQTDDLYNSRGIDSPVNFATWMAYGFPLSLIVNLAAWAWLNILYLRCNGLCACLSDDPEKELRVKNIRNVIQTQYNDLGRITYAQVNVMVVFVTLVLLWISRDLGGIGGWGELFAPGMVKDSTPAISMAILLFILPSKLPKVFCFRTSEYAMTEQEREDAKLPVRALLTWKVVHEKMPWSLVFLLGGGYAMAKACELSGLSLWVGNQLTVLQSLNPWLMLLILCYVCTSATEVTSNTATATLILPILSNLAIATGTNPLFYMFPAALSVSFAYMLPAATPPNAIVFSYGHIKVSDMATAGIVMNIITTPLLLMATATWGNAIFHFDVTPDAFLTNSSIPVNFTSS